MADMTELMQKCISENARAALDQSEYGARYGKLCERYNAAKSRLDGVSEEIAGKKLRLGLAENFIAELSRQDGLVAEFDGRLWNSLLDCVLVNSAEDVRFVFKDGTEIRG